MTRASGVPQSPHPFSSLMCFQISPLGVSSAHQFCSKSIRRSKAPSIVKKRRRKKNPGGQEAQLPSKALVYTDGNSGNNAPIKKCHDHDTAAAGHGHY